MNDISLLSLQNTKSDTKRPQRVNREPGNWKWPLSSTDLCGHMGWETLASLQVPAINKLHNLPHQNSDMYQ